VGVVVAGGAAVGRETTMPHLVTRTATLRGRLPRSRPSTRRTTRREIAGSSCDDSATSISFPSRQREFEPRPPLHVELLVRTSVGGPGAAS
jgi:hypothetical protein